MERVCHHTVIGLIGGPAQGFLVLGLADLQLTSADTPATAAAAAANESQGIAYLPMLVELTASREYHLGASVGFQEVVDELNMTN